MGSIMPFTSKFRLTLSITLLLGVAHGTRIRMASAEKGIDACGEEATANGCYTSCDYKEGPPKCWPQSADLWNDLHSACKSEVNPTGRAKDSVWFKQDKGEHIIFRMLDAWALYGPALERNLLCDPEFAILYVLKTPEADIPISTPKKQWSHLGGTYWGGSTQCPKCLGKPHLRDRCVLCERTGTVACTPRTRLYSVHRAPRRTTPVPRARVRTTEPWSRVMALKSMKPRLDDDELDDRDMTELWNKSRTTEEKPDIKKPSAVAKPPAEAKKPSPKGFVQISKRLHKRQWQNHLQKLKKHGLFSDQFDPDRLRRLLHHQADLQQQGRDRARP